MSQLIIQVVGKTCRIYKEQLLLIMNEYACRYAGCNEAQKNIITKYMLDLSVIIKNHYIRRANITDSEVRKEFVHALNVRVSKALESFSPEGGAKFNTWLTWHFKRCLSDHFDNLKSSKETVELDETLYEHQGTKTDWLLEQVKLEANRVLSLADYRLFIGYYVYEFTFEELADKYSMTKEGMRKKIYLMLEVVAKACSKKGFTL